MTSTRTEAAAAVSIGAALALRERDELLGLLRPCFARTEPWLQAGKYVSALASELPRVNGWSIARRGGDRTPDRTQRLLNHASWDTFAAMGGPDQMNNWFTAEPKVAYKDRVHFTDIGYQRWADALSGALLTSYDQWRVAQHLAPTQDTRPLPPIQVSPAPLPGDVGVGSGSAVSSPAP